MDRIYYKVTGGAALAGIKKWQEDHANAEEKRRLFVKQFPGATSYYSGSEGIRAIVFESPDQKPKGWIKDKKGGYRPNKARPEFKDLARQFLIPSPQDSADFQKYIDPKLHHFSFMSGMRWSTLAFEKVGDVYVLSAPDCDCANDDATDILDEKQKRKWKAPKGCVELKMSEYYKMKEDWEEKKKQIPSK